MAHKSLLSVLIFSHGLYEPACTIGVFGITPLKVYVNDIDIALNNNLEILNEDVLKVDLNELIVKEVNSNEIEKVKIVANLPYYITTPIIMKLLEEKINVESITVMIQKEVADRLCAIPGKKDTGAITYTVYYYSEPEKVIEVSKDKFIPQPKVDSEVIKLKIREVPFVKVQNEEIFFKVIKYAFMQRRKTLINALSMSDLFKDKDEIKEIIQKIGLDERVRGESLSINDYAKITEMLQSPKNF